MGGISNKQNHLKLVMSKIFIEDFGSHVKKYRSRQRLSVSKYYLVVEGRVKERITTNVLNREVVLVDLIKIADGRKFTISVVEKDVPIFVLDSWGDKKFINFLTF